MRHLPTITIKSIPHKKQRYDTAGDYYYDKNTWQFRISRMKEDYEFMVLLHELIEWYLVRKRGISVKDIDAWDIEHIEHPDPGMIENAPYHKEHVFAMSIEHLICKQLKLNWIKYDKNFENLVYKKGKK